MNPRRESAEEVFTEWFCLSGPGSVKVDRALRRSMAIMQRSRAIARRTANPLHTVRGSFAEGDPIYPGSKILQKSHTQIAVRDPTCILRASLVQFL